MFGVETVEFIITLFAFIFAYLTSSTLAGIFRAWTAKKMGDDTGEQYGFLTLNPAQHVDFFGLLCWIIGGIGWGKIAPVNDSAITGRLKPLKILFLRLSCAIAYVVLAIIGLVTLFSLFGRTVFFHLLKTLQTGTLYHHSLAHSFPHISSWNLSLGVLLITNIYLNVVFALFATLNVISKGIVTRFSQIFPTRLEHNYLLFLAIPLITWFILLPFLGDFIAKLILYSGITIAYLLGVVS